MCLYIVQISHAGSVTYDRHERKIAYVLVVDEKAMNVGLEKYADVPLAFLLFLSWQFPQSLSLV